MERDYIEYGGKKYRFECNWRAISSYLQKIGQDTLSGLAELKNMKPSQIAGLFCECIAEGERLDGRESDFKEEYFLESRDLVVLTQCMDLYIAQQAPKTRNEEVEKKD